MSKGLVVYMSYPLSQQSDFLRTKFLVPRIREGSILRPELFSKLSASPKLSLLTAPAGYGKTTLVVDWLFRENLNVHWLSLDITDNKLDTFWEYVLGSLAKNACLDLSRAYANRASVHIMLKALVNTLSECDEPVRLVLDDYHLLSNEDIDASLAWLIDHAPPQLYVILISRQVPSLPLANWRAKGDLLELDVQDLRFSQAETAAFLQVAGYALKEEDANLLFEHTEGWVAGLQLAVLSLAKTPDLSVFIRDFKGDHPYVQDYLASEILGQQSIEQRNFLLKTSILERFNAELAKAVSQQDQAADLLIKLAKDNGFIIALDAQAWFRYHHLFAESLQVELKKAFSKEVPELYLRASAWFEAQADLPQAIHYALLSGVFKEAMRLLKQQLASVLAADSQQVKTWLECLPKEVLKTEPDLCFSYLWALHVLGEKNFERRFTPLMDHTEQLAKTAGNQIVLAELLMLRASLSSTKGDIDECLSYARNALALLPENAYGLRSYCYVLLASQYGYILEVDRAINHYETARKYAELSDVPDLLPYIQQFLSTLYIRLGHYEQASHLLLDLFARHAEKVTVSTINARFFLAAIYLQWNQLDLAITYAKEAIAMREEAYKEKVNALWVGYVVWAQALAAQAKFEQAKKVMNSALKAADSVGEDRLKTVRAFEAQIHLMRGDKNHVEHWMSLCDLDLKKIDSERFTEYLSFLTALITKKAFVKAERLFKTLLKKDELNKRKTSLCETLILGARLYYARGDLQKARGFLERSIAIAKTEKFVRMFLNAGQGVFLLLKACVEDSPNKAYIETLLKAFHHEEKVLSFDDSVKPLSKRELEVLNLLAKGQANQDIAHALGISLSTVKLHIRNIFHKLLVKTRVQAVIKAQELELLS